MLNSSLPGESGSPQNRRRSRRLKPVGDDVVTLYTADDRWPGIVVDESEGGFGVAVRADVTLVVGDTVRVTAKRQVLKTVVVSRAERPGGIRLGLKCS